MSEMPSTEINSEFRVEEYLKLLLAFRALPATKRRQTFMEVSGYPHYENVCSNILRFYFDPSAEHGLKDLLLSAFLRVAGEMELVIPEKVMPSREHPAEDQQRIDLVIDCETFTLGIENKIFHWEANDFENYARVIERLGRNKKTIKALLCLKKDESQQPPKGGFIRYTYGQLWQQVRGMLGNYISEADPKWVTCLLDFMETTTNLAGCNMEHKKLDQFFVENHELLERMVTERDAFLSRLNQKVTQLMTMLREPAAARGLSDPWVYQKSCLVLDFKFQDLHAIAFDLYISPKGWELQLFGRNGTAGAYLGKLMKHSKLSARLASVQASGDRFIVQTWPIEADLGEIRDVLCSWIGALIDADTAEAGQE